jgi:dTMP kinase
MNAIEEVDRMSPEARAAYEAAKVEEEKARQKAEEEARRRAEEAARIAAEYAA